jgi:hypothetical protein
MRQTIDPFHSDKQSVSVQEVVSSVTISPRFQMPREQQPTQAEVMARKPCRRKWQELLDRGNNKSRIRTTSNVAQNNSEQQLHLSLLSSSA